MKSNLEEGMAKNKFTAWVRSKWGGLMSNGSYKAQFFMGMLNGLLPCGLVYIALASATATGSVINGAIFMAVFGLGTLPMLWGISMAGSGLKKFAQKYSARRAG